MNVAHETVAEPITGPIATVRKITGGWVVTGDNGRVAVHDYDMTAVPIGPNVPDETITMGFGVRAALLATDWSNLP